MPGAEGSELDRDQAGRESRNTDARGHGRDEAVDTVADAGAAERQPGPVQGPAYLGSRDAGRGIDDERQGPGQVEPPALSSRSYRIYLGGQSLANTGTWMQSIAQDWLVYDLTHSSTCVGVTMALQFLPILSLGLYTGGVADRLPKRRILLTTQMLNAAATAALAAITIAGAVRPADV